MWVLVDVISMSGMILFQHLCGLFRCGAHLLIGLDLVNFKLWCLGLWIFGVMAAEDFGVQRRAFVRNCAASWLLLCTATMAETAGAQPSSMGRCSCQARVSY